MSTINKLKLWLLTIMMVVGASVWGHTNVVSTERLSSEEQDVGLEVIEANDASYLIVSTTNLNFSAVGGTRMFSIASNVDWTIEVEGGDGWLTVSPMIGNGDSDVSVTSQAYSNIPPREATITLSGDGLFRTINVYQYGEGYLITSITSLLFNPSGYAQKFYITSNVDWTIEVEGGNGWLEVTPTSKTVSGNNVTEITVKAADNTSNITSREATLIISGNGLLQTVKVCQLAGWSPGPGVKQLRFNSAGGSSKIIIQSSESWTIDVTGGIGWLTISSTSGTGHEEVTVTAFPNTGMLQREATISINANDITQVIEVIQDGNGYLIASTSSIVFSHSESTQAFNIISNLDWSIIINGDNSCWLKVTPTNGEPGNHTIYVSVMDNQFGPREAIITIKGGDAGFGFLTENILATQVGIDNSINTIENDEAASPVIYTVHGQKIDCKSKWNLHGIYIIKGKKMVIK